MTILQLPFIYKMFVIAIKVFTSGFNINKPSENVYSFQEN